MVLRRGGASGFWSPLGSPRRPGPRAGGCRTRRPDGLRLVARGDSARPVDWFIYGSLGTAWAADAGRAASGGVRNRDTLPSPRVRGAGSARCCAPGWIVGALLGARSAPALFIYGLLWFFRAATGLTLGRIGRAEYRNHGCIRLGRADPPLLRTYDNAGSVLSPDPVLAAARAWAGEWTE